VTFEFGVGEAFGKRNTSLIPVAVLVITSMIPLRGSTRSDSASLVAPPG
jgi:hypothetical protein